MVFENILAALSHRDLILPYFEASLLADKWPDFYQVNVDSRPYYGLNPDGTPDGYFHPSTHAMLGERELYYRFHPDTAPHLVFERRSLQGQLAMTIGSAMHAVLQTQMSMVGLIKDPKNIEREYIDTAHHVRGRIDWVVDHPNGTQLVTEFKTRASHLYARQTEPEPSWVAQLNLALDAMDQDLGVLLMAETGFPYRMREFHVKRDRRLIELIYAKFDRVREAIARNDPPRHCCAPESEQMHKCVARYVCWLAPDVEEVGENIEQAL